MSGHFCGGQRGTAVVKPPSGLLWAMVSPLRWPTRCPPGLWVCAVREWPEPGISVSHGALAVPGVTWFVATTFSPCPLAQEWKHRILRSPHDVGQVGTCTDAPL